MTRHALLVNDTSIYLQHGCNIVTDTIVEQLEKRGYIVTTYVAESDWKKNPGFIARLQKSDLIVVNGEGNIHHGHGEHLLQIGPFASKHAIPTVLINTVYQENPRHFADYLRAFDLIIVRESYSKKELEELNVDAQVIADISLYESENELATKRSGYAISDSVVSETTQKLRSQYPTAPLLPTRTRVPIIYWKYLWSHLRKIKLTEAFRKLTAIIFNVIMYPFKYHSAIRVTTPNEYTRLIGSYSGILAARFHTVCFALKSRTPFFAIASNSYKIEGLLADANLAHRMIRLEELPESLGALDFAWSNSELAELNTFLQHTTTEWNKAFDHITALRNN